jgi:hypothetical protein
MTYEQMLSVSQFCELLALDGRLVSVRHEPPSSIVVVMEDGMAQTSGVAPMLNAGGKKMGGKKGGKRGC